MTAPRTTRVVLAATASTDAALLVTEGATLAGTLGLELVALFVEDAVLLRVAALPITREVGMTSGTIRALEVEDMARVLRHHAEEVRRLVGTAATERGLRWSFRVTRGTVVDAALETAGTDVVLLAPQRSGLGRVLSSRTAARPPLPAEPAASVAVFFDESDSGSRALEAAYELAGRRAEAVSLVLSERADPGPLRRLAAERMRLATGLPPAVVAGDLRRGLRRRAVVMSVSGPAGGAVEVRRLLAVTDSPVVLVP